MSPPASGTESADSSVPTARAEVQSLLSFTGQVCAPAISAATVVTTSTRDVRSARKYKQFWGDSCLAQRSSTTMLEGCAAKLEAREGNTRVGNYSVNLLQNKKSLTEKEGCF